MFKVAIDAHWQLRKQDGTPLVPRLTALLVGIQQTGTLAAACRSAGLTYRYAWGLLRDGERAFGHSLVASQRGRGAKLTPLGERLAWADQRIAARLAPLLDSEEGTSIWEVWLAASRVSLALEQAIAAAEPAVLAKYAFTLAQTFSNFYHRHRVLTESDPARKTLLFATAAVARREITRLTPLP